VGEKESESYFPRRFNATVFLFTLLLVIWWANQAEQDGVSG